MSPIWHPLKITENTAVSYIEVQPFNLSIRTMFLLPVLHPLYTSFVDTLNIYLLTVCHLLKLRIRHKQRTACPLHGHLTSRLACITACKTSTQSNFILTLFLSRTFIAHLCPGSVRWLVQLYIHMYDLHVLWEHIICISHWFHRFASHPVFLTDLWYMPYHLGQLSNRQQLPESPSKSIAHGTDINYSFRSISVARMNTTGIWLLKCLRLH